MACEILPGDLERGGAGVDAVQLADPWGDEAGPAATAASRVEALCVRWQRSPGEDFEVLLEMAAELLLGHPGLVEALPLVAEAGDGSVVDVSGLLRSRGQEEREPSSSQKLERGGEGDEAVR